MKAERLVCLNGLLCKARIGVYEEERLRGGEFLIDVELAMSVLVQEEAVDLDETIDYEKVLALISGELAEPEYLLETVANRIVIRCKEAFPQAERMMIHIQKKNPPLKAEVDSSSVKLVLSF